MPSGKRAKQMRREAVRTPPPVRSKGAPGARQASPRVLAIAGIVVLVIVAAVLAVVFATKSSGGGNLAKDVPAQGSASWKNALPGATDVRKLFAGIPQQGLFLGSSTAPATLTEFIDLQCPLCQQFETQQFPTIVTKYVKTGKLKIRMEPWSILDRPGTPPDSNRGQAATIAASLQNRAFQFASMLYLNQGQEDSGWLTDQMINLAAASVDGMQVSQVLGKMGSSGVQSIVKGVDQRAATAGFNATPTLLLNKKGKPAHVVSVGVPTLSTLESQIDAAVSG
jgi:protein-disulfide isomerase